MSEIELIHNRLRERSKKIQAQRQIVKLFIVSSCLIFLTLLLVWFIKVRPQAVIPGIYSLSTLVILLSSLSLLFAHRAIDANRIQRAVYFTVMCIGMGMIFGITQYSGWNTLMESTELTQSILLPFSIIHFAHILVGLAFLLIVFIRLRDYQIHSKAMDFSSNVFYFWHFLGLVWVVFIGLLA